MQEKIFLKKIHDMTPFVMDCPVLSESIQNILSHAMKSQENLMNGKKNDELPPFLVYNAENELDISATLRNIPESPDKKLCFFREVPEWFEADPADLEEMRSTLTAVDNMPEEERKKYMPQDLQKMRSSIERMICCCEMMADPALSRNQKEVLRCIAYWISLEAMNSVPLTPEEVEELFG